MSKKHVQRQSVQTECLRHGHSVSTVARLFESLFRKAAYLLASVTLSSPLSTSNAAETTIDLARWAMDLPAHFAAAGVKTEPTYQVAVEIWRNGDRVVIRGGAPQWMARSVEGVTVDKSGAITHDICPPGMRCEGPARPAGFLSTAALIAALRRGTLTGTAQIESYGDWRVVCVPAEMLGVARPILDPCFEIGSGAAIAEKNRDSHTFDGPILEPTSIRLVLTGAARLQPIPSAHSLPSSPIARDKAS